MQETVRVLHLLTAIIPNGGVQSCILSYGNETLRHGVVFDYIVQGPGDAELEKTCRDAGSRIFRVPEMTKHPLGFMTGLHKLLMEHPEYQMLHVHQNFINFMPLLAARGAKVKIRISHSHASYQTAAVKQLIRRVARAVICRGATEKWACSEPAYEWLYGEPYTEGPHSCILHNAIDCGRFAFQRERRETLRSAAGLRDEFVCICVGTLSSLKNQTFLLDVMAELRARQTGRRIQLWIVGEGAARGELEEKCLRLGLSDTVRFWGARKDVPDLLLQADCFLLPSFAEGLPVSAVEAQISGLPCVLSAGIPREVKFRDNVAFHETGTEKVWAEQILRFSEAEPERDAPLPEDFGYDITQEAEKLAAKYKALAASVR